MLTTRAAASTAGIAAARARSRNLALVLATALGGRGAPPPARPVRYAARVFGGRHVPVLASAGDLTPYVAEILTDEVLHAPYGSRVDLFVDADACPVLRTLTRRLERITQRGLDIHVHDRGPEIRAE